MGKCEVNVGGKSWFFFVFLGDKWENAKFIMWSWGHVGEMLGCVKVMAKGVKWHQKNVGGPLNAFKVIMRRH